MTYTRAHLLLALFNALYIVPFSIQFIVRGNYEFLGYVAQIIVLGLVVALTLKRSHFPVWLLSLLSLWGLAHVAGGGVEIGDHVLYAQHFFYVWSSGEDYILKYDQIVHFYGFFVATLVMYWLLIPQLRTGARVAVVACVAACAGMGLGALNEIIEFTAYALLPATGVGGYVNTALDLVANGLGALTAAFLILYHAHRVSDTSTREPGLQIRS